MTSTEPPPAPDMEQPWMGLLGEAKEKDAFFFLCNSEVPFDERLDRWDAFAATLPAVDLPLTHRFPKGMYVREIFMPAGTIVTTRVHLFENPFFIMQGRVSVISENEGVVEYSAPHSGVTMPGTRRAIYIHEDTVWATVHLNPTDSTDHEALLDAHSFVPENRFLIKENAE